VLRDVRTNIPCFKPKTMPTPLITLSFVHRITKGELHSVHTYDNVFPGIDLRTALYGAIEDVCIDRLLLAEGFLNVAQQLAKNPDEASMRTSIGRSYYSVHHSLRTMLLWKNKWDPDGHEQVIEVLKDLLSEASFCASSTLAVDDYENVTEAKKNREIADYSPYETQRKPPSIEVLPLTGNSWTAAAKFNGDLAERYLNSAVKFVGL
jgi:uncharacterized protein (UPF0332 family)